MKKRGVIYCATTSPAYLEAALISAMALRQHEPEIPITLISDQPLLQLLPLHEYGIEPQLIEVDKIDPIAFTSRQIKTRLNIFSDYQETLFLDADILPLQPIASLWSYLDQEDLAMVVDRLPTISLCDHIAQEEKSYTLQRLAADTVQFNSGVMLWRSTPAIQSFFEQWYREWLTFQKHDQLAMVRAIHTTQISITKLPRTYNISPIDAAPLMAEKHNVHLLHCWGGMVNSGKFCQFAQKFYPGIVETVIRLLANYSPLPDTRELQESNASVV